MHYMCSCLWQTYTKHQVQTSIDWWGDSGDRTRDAHSNTQGCKACHSCRWPLPAWTRHYVQKGSKSRIKSELIRKASVSWLTTHSSPSAIQNAPRFVKLSINDLLRGIAAKRHFKIRQDPAWIQLPMASSRETDVFLPFYQQRRDFSQRYIVLKSYWGIKRWAGCHCFLQRWT
jgi:hypothetical protein